MAPVNQSAAIGSNASFNCSATGNPKPTITWIKDNDSVPIQAKVETNDEKTHSQLVIRGVTREDYGKYVCVANNSAGVEYSHVAVLHQGDLSLSVINSFILRFFMWGAFGLSFIH